MGKAKLVPKRSQDISSKNWLYLPLIVAIFSAALLVYLPSFNGPFLFDDPPSTIYNPYLQVPDLQASSLFRAAFQDYKQNRPLSNLSFAFNFYFNQNRPFGYHLVNFCFHFLGGFSLFFLLQRILFRKTRDRKYSFIFSALASLLWTVHPVNTQAVSYIVQRHTCMAGGFCLACFLCYDLARSRKRTVLYVLSALCGLAAMLCKESVYILPGLILLYELWFFQELKPGWLKKIWKWFPALAIFYAGLALLIFRPSMRESLGEDIARMSFTPWEHFLSQGRAFLWYPGLVIFPSNSFLTVLHQFPVSKTIITPWSTLPAWVLVLGVLAAVLVYARRFPLLSFGVLWYFSNLAIETMPLPIDTVFEHRLYLADIPLIGLVPTLVLMLKRRSHMLVIALCLTLFFGVAGFKRNQVWADQERFWADNVSKAPGLGSSWGNYCSVLVSARKEQKALPVCKRAVALDPLFPGNHNNLGLALVRLGHFDEAGPEYEQALKLKPDYPEAYYNRGLLKALRHDFAGAGEDWRKALELKPRNVPLLCELGEVFDSINDQTDSWRSFRAALELQPDSAEARARWALVLAKRKMCREAEQLILSSPFPDPRFPAILAHCRK